MEDEEKGPTQKAVAKSGEAGGGNDDVPERSAWSNQLEFFFSCVGYAVGLGNVWRFPYLTYQYGGGAFLIPYVIMLIICGLPLFFLELSFGQFAALGPITIWRVCPLFTGVGFAMVTISMMVSVYYNVIVMYAIFYMVVSIISMDGDLPWASCGNKWNTDYCVENIPNITGLTDDQKVNKTLSRMDLACVDKSLKGASMTMLNVTYNMTQSKLLKGCDKTVLPSEEYYSRFVLGLNESDGIGDLDGMSWKLVAVLIIAWVVLFYSLRKGVETSGKIVYFMATFPYAVLIALLIRGVTLEGYIEGVKFYIIPEWDKLADINVWREAATQIFYSLGPAFGSLITLASYNSFKHNCYRDAISVAIINCSTSIFAGFVIFSMLGYMAHVTNQDIQDVTSSGPGLVFVVYPEGIARMPAAPLWAFLFFFMLVALGLDSQFAMFEAVISAIIDEFPNVLRKRRVLFTGVCHAVGFMLGLPLVTKGGIYVLTLMNGYSASYALMFTCLCEVIALNYVYGNKRFLEDIETMLGFQPGIYWRATWMVITPLAIVVMLIASGIQYEPVKYDTYEFEGWAQGVGFGMVALPVFLIIAVGLYQICKHGGIRAAITPHPDWGQHKIKSVGEGNSNEGYQGDEMTDFGNSNNGTVIPMSIKSHE